MALREQSDAGVPVVFSDPDDPAAQALRQGARGLIALSPIELPVMQLQGPPPPAAVARRPACRCRWPESPAPGGRGGVPRRRQLQGRTSIRRDSARLCRKLVEVDLLAFGHQLLEGVAELGGQRLLHGRQPQADGAPALAADPVQDTLGPK